MERFLVDCFISSFHALLIQRSCLLLRDFGTGLLGLVLFFVMFLLFCLRFPTVSFFNLCLALLSDLFGSLSLEIQMRGLRLSLIIFRSPDRVFGTLVGAFSWRSCIRCVPCAY